jgi:hypothetical protein
MKKILAIALMTVSASAFAWHNNGYYNNGYRNNWVAPFVVGAGIGYLANRQYYVQPVYYPPQVVYVQPQVTYVQQANPIPVGYRQENILDSNCNCYRTVLVPN